MKRFATLLLLLGPGAALGQNTRPYLDVGSPDLHALPIAVSPFKAESAAQPAAAEIAQVLRNDLLLSGLFDVLDPKSFLADPAEGLAAPAIRFARWADVGAEGLVKAYVRRNGADLTAEFHLYEVRAGKEVLFQVHKERSTRALAHAFADDMIQYYTHERGMFRTRLAAVRKASKGGREIVLFDVDGANPEVVLREPTLALLPNWRPDGADLLFTSYRRGRPELWLLDLAKRTTRLASSLGELTTGGVYSPDGKRIAFTAAQEGNSDIWVMNVDGGAVTRLTRDPATDTSPTWSPDGRRIAFVSVRFGTPQIYVMNADGSDQRRLTFQGNYNQTPRWSPRGDLIAFTARDERKVFDVFTVSPDTGKIQRVTQDQGRTNEEPTWAPNGLLLAFTSDRAGRPQVVISTPNGGRQQAVTNDPGELATVSWGPLPR